MDEKQTNWLKKILGNGGLLKWLKKFGSEGLQEELNGDAFEVETCEDSICLTDGAGIKMLFTDSRFSGKTYVSFDIKQIKEALTLAGEEGRLIINEHDNKRLCYIQSNDNIEIIAPTSEETESKPKKKSSKSKKKVDVEDTEDTD